MHQPAPGPQPGRLITGGSVTLGACTICYRHAYSTLERIQRAVENLAPAAMHEMCVAALNGDREKATAINENLMGLHENLFLEANPIPVKWALSEMGMMPNGIRLPLTVFSEQYHETLRQAMRQANVLS